MQCLYCGKALGLLRELTDSEFCSREHRQHYQRLTKLAFHRLRDQLPEPAGVKPRPCIRFEGLPPPRAAPPTPAASRGRGLPLSPLEMRSTAHNGCRLGSLPRLGHAAASVLGCAEASLPAIEPIAIRCLHDDRPVAPMFQGIAKPSQQVLHALRSPAVLAGAGILVLPPPFPARAPLAGRLPVETLAFSAPIVSQRTATLQLQLIDPPCAVEAAEAPEVDNCLPLAAFRMPALPPCQGESRFTVTLASLPPALTPVLPRMDGGALPVLAAAPPVGEWAPPVTAASAPQMASLPMTARVNMPAVVLERVSALPARSLMPVGPSGSIQAGAMIAGSHPLACSSPSVRLPSLQALPDSLALPAKEQVMEEFFGADVPAVPVRASVDPSIGPMSLLPALASLFGYGRPVQNESPLPYLQDGVTPQNRPGFPSAYMEVSMPERRPIVPRSTGLRIVETFEYLRPLERPELNLIERLVRLWSVTPVYVRYAAVTICVMLLFWVSLPGAGIGSLFESRWSRIQADIRSRAAIELTEDFQGDMQAWEGQGDWTRSWRLEKAGYARPGRLALYQPSMQMRDYRMEFLVQIEKQAVSWVYRATDQENYYATKITIVRPGPLPVLSLVRYPVIGGKQGQRVEIPIRILMHNNTPYRVELTVNGQEFSTSIEGQLVDFWRDDVHKTGGFGFFSDSGERARVYWMKLSHQDDFIGRVCAYFDPMPVDKRRSMRSYQ